MKEKVELIFQLTPRRFREWLEKSTEKEKKEVLEEIYLRQRSVSTPSPLKI